MIGRYLEWADMTGMRPWGGFWSGTWRRRGGLNGHRLTLEVFLIGIVFVAVPYFSTNNIAEAYLSTVFDPEIALDRQIPVWNWTILPYALLYAFYPATLILAPRDDSGRIEMILTIQMMIMVTAFCCVIFLLLPAEIDMRDQIDWGTMSAWEDALFTFIHSSDNPWNAWPSLHIVHSYILARVMTHWMIGRRASSLVPWNFAIFILWLEWTLLAISILTTKQHYMFDLVTGVIVAHLAWLALERALSNARDLGPSRFTEESGWTD